MATPTRTSGDIRRTEPLVKRKAWKALQAHYKKVRELRLRDLFANDTTRGERLTAETVGIFLDYSKKRITDETLKLLVDRTEESGLRARIDAMFRGEKISITEKWAVRLVCCALLCAALSLFPPSADLYGQQSGPPPASPVNAVTRATHVLGLEHVKHGAKGRLMIADKSLRFESGASVATISIPSIQDVFTGEESQELVRGKTGILVELAMPYESSRVVSLLASRKIDVSTLEYRDSNGGLHGVIFTLPKGQAPVLMRLLVNKGSNASFGHRATTKP